MNDKKAAEEAAKVVEAFYIKIKAQDFEGTKSLLSPYEKATSTETLTISGKDRESLQLEGYNVSSPELLK